MNVDRSCDLCTYIHIYIISALSQITCTWETIYIKSTQSLKKRYTLKFISLNVSSSFYIRYHWKHIKIIQSDFSWLVIDQKAQTWALKSIPVTLVLGCLVFGPFLVVFIRLFIRHALPRRQLWAVRCKACTPLSQHNVYDFFAWLSNWEMNYENVSVFNLLNNELICPIWNNFPINKTSTHHHTLIWT